jgi:hypothetical protein
MSSPEDLEKMDLTRDPVESIVKELASDERVNAFSEAEQKAIIRRIDIRLVLTLGSLYCISLLDRTNLGAASVAGYARFGTFSYNGANRIFQNAENFGHECNKQRLHNCFGRIFQHILHISSSSDRPYSSNWSSELSFCNCSLLGRHHDSKSPTSS